MNSENTPHIVYPKGLLEGEVRMFRTYKAAHRFYKRMSNYKTPYLIATVGRVIDPSVPVIDVNE